MAQRISEGKFNLDLYKATIVKALNLENDLKDLSTKEGFSSYKVEALVQSYLYASSISSKNMLGSDYTEKALSAAYDSAANLAWKMADYDHFEKISTLVLKPLRAKAIDRLDSSPNLSERYYNICLKLGERYKFSTSVPDAAAAFREAALFSKEVNLEISKDAKVNPQVEAYNLFFEWGDYLYAADWAKEVGLDNSKVSAAATAAYDIRFKSEYIHDLERGLEIAREYNLGADKISAVGKKICKILAGLSLEKEAQDISLAAYYQGQIAFYAKKAGLEDLAEKAAIKACQMKFKAAENAKDNNDIQKTYAYLFILDVAKTYDLDKETILLAQDKLNKLQAEQDAKKIERENLNKAAADLLFSTWFEAKRS